MSEQKPAAVPKELTAEELAELNRKRAIFKSVHDLYADLSWQDAEASLQDIIGAFYKSVEDEQKVKSVKDYAVVADAEDEQAKKAVEILADLPLEEAGKFVAGLANAISIHARIKTKDEKVSELGIHIFDQKE